jgi:TRAP-type C4-dicarboxylate transport system permease small subunit
MGLGKVVRILEHIVDPISKWMNYISVFVLMIMIFFVAVDVIGRYLFEHPLESSYEGVMLMMVMVFAFGIAYTQRKKGHVAVDMLVNRFGPKAQAVTDIIVNFICLGFLSILTWQSLVKAQADFVTKESSLGRIGGIAYVPIYPFYFLVSLTLTVLTLVFLVDFLVSIARLSGYKDLNTQAKAEVLSGSPADRVVKS